MLAGVENLWRGAVVEHLGSHMVQIGTELVSADVQALPIGASVIAVLAASEVLLTRAEAGRTSARNVWPGRVVTITRRGREVAVHVDCRGVPLIALITPAAMTDLELAVGTEVFALFKAAAARVFRA
jgi:molybdopterin-binding protein